MRKFLLFLLILLHKNTFSQLYDKFDDGDFLFHPTWSGPSAEQNFIIDRGLLRSNSTTANTNFFLVTANKLAKNTIWEFDCNLQLATSGSNYADIYIISNTQDLSNNNLVNGYFIRIGNTDDEISLFKRSGRLNTAVKIIDGQNNTVSSNTNNPFKIRITRTESGEFTLEWDKSQTGNQFHLEGRVTDNQFMETDWFGIYIQQSTPTFHKKHYFGNFIIKEIETDTEAPEITSYRIDKNRITVLFNEPINLQTIDLWENFRLKPFLALKNITINPQEIILEYEEEFETDEYQLTILRIQDYAGNINDAPLNIAFNHQRPYIPKPLDIVINEIFADPNPQIDLPGSEFIELWNRTSHKISLKDLKYSDLTTTYTFGDEYIHPDEFLILCPKNDTLEYKGYGRTIGVSPWPILNNDKDLLTLGNADGTIIHQVQYFDAWYRDPVKKNGGYSLELIDPDSGCINSQNYAASTDIRGGTPGQQNSVYMSNVYKIPLSVSSVSLKDSVTVRITFNRAIDSLKSSYKINYHIKGIGYPKSVSIDHQTFSAIELNFERPFEHAQTYSLLIDKICDCGDSKIEDQQLIFSVPSKPARGKILINEILFNPRSGGKDFVELYNHSNETFDFKDLFISSTDINNDIINIKTISTKSILFKPGTYWVITTDPENIQTEYFSPNPDNFIKVPSLPAFNNDRGVAVLLDKDNNRIDQLNYNRNMHFPLLKEEKGVSLERSFFSEETNKIGNFRSATSNVGYATPAYKNSQSTEQYQPDKEGINLSSKVISPDNDGTNDILSISYQLHQNNYVANACIYNDQGLLIKKLVQNEQVSYFGTWIWDGFDNNQTLVKTGIYILHTEFFDLEGNVKQYKSAFSVVVRK